MRTKSNIKKQLHDLLKSSNEVDTVFYYNGTFHIIQDCKLLEISQDEAFNCLDQNTKFWHLIQDERKFDTDLNKWIGKEPVFIRPDGLPKCKVVNITCAFPLIEFVNFHIILIKNASNNPIITGVNIIKDK